MKFQLRLLLIPIGVVVGSGLFLWMVRRPGIFASSKTLGAILMAEIVVGCLWRFDKVFFPVTMGCFLLAGTPMPFSGESLILRWLFLAVGALVGFILWMRTNRTQHFATFHLVALFCVLSALASASASNSPSVGSLKTGSLFLLFLYCATGVRVALAGNERSLVGGLVVSCEVVVFITAAAYFLDFNIFGDPNNLGAFIGVIATPILLWGALTAGDRVQRRRRYVALGLCAVLLYLTVCRAAIVADMIVALVLTVGLRRPRMLVRAAFAGVLLLELMAVTNPTHTGEFLDSLSGRFILKAGRTHVGVLASRQSPWDETISAVRRHPWFGTGFGTSEMTAERPEAESSSVYTLNGSNREHGSSYLALAEYMGMLGILPFVLLLILLIRATVCAYSWMHKARSPYHYAVPFALVTIAGLIHAAFEDWLFAPGSYICLFFWASAFLLIDLTAKKSGEARSAVAQPIPLFVESGLRRSATSL
jgi:O-antigen ligase